MLCGTPLLVSFRCLPTLSRSTPCDSDCALFVFISKRELPFDIPQKVPSAVTPRPLFRSKNSAPDAPAPPAAVAEPAQSMRKKIGASSLHSRPSHQSHFNREPLPSSSRGGDTKIPSPPLSRNLFSLPESVLQALLDPNLAGRGRRRAGRSSRSRGRCAGCLRPGRGGAVSSHPPDDVQSRGGPRDCPEAVRVGRSNRCDAPKSVGR